MSPKFNLEPTAGESVELEHHDFGIDGYLAYDPRTLYIMAGREGQPPVHRPVMMTGKFFGTKQPYIPTCSEPSENNKGCPKWAGCPLKKYVHVGPGAVIMRKHATVSFANCYDFFETTRGGRATSQLHYGMEGWKLDTTRTTIDVLGRGWAIKAGLLTPTSTRDEIMSTPARTEEIEIRGLLPPWWPLLKKKGLPLPPTAEHYPELAEEDEAPKRSRRAKR